MTNDDFKEAHIAHQRASFAADQARAVVRAAPVERAKLTYQNKPAKTQPLVELMDELQKAERLEVDAYSKLWRIANSDKE